MTLARTALRLIATAALKGAPGARPTIAEGRVYDSRNSDIAPEEYSEDAKPVVIVLTDNDEGDALSKQNGGPPFHRNIDLVVEIGMVARAALYDDNDEPIGYSIGYPDTDARLEASLDLLEFQITRCLAYDLNPLSALFRKTARIWKHECHRQVEDTPGIKIACRILTLTCEVQDDRVSILNQADTQPTGLDVLPEPLRSVAKALPAGSSGADIASTMAAELTPITAPPLEGVDVSADASEGRPGVETIDVNVNLD